jgi:hypothetical protein
MTDTEKSQAETGQMPLPQLCAMIKAQIEKGDKASEKAEQFYKAAGLHLKELQNRKPDGVKWEKYVKDQCGIGKTRAWQLIQLADGRTTLDKARTETRERMRGFRAVARSARAEPSVTEIKNYHAEIRAEILQRVRQVETFPNLLRCSHNLAQSEREEIAKRSAQALQNILTELGGSPQAPGIPDNELAREGQRTKDQAERIGVIADGDAIAAMSDDDFAQFVDDIDAAVNTLKALLKLAHGTKRREHPKPSAHRPPENLATSRADDQEFPGFLKRDANNIPAWEHRK